MLKISIILAKRIFIFYKMVFKNRKELKINKVKFLHLIYPKEEKGELKTGDFIRLVKKEIITKSSRLQLKISANKNIHSIIISLLIKNNRKNGSKAQPFTITLLKNSDFNSNKKYNNFNNNY